MHRDRIFAGCPDHWNFNFDLYEEDKSIEQTIPLYNYVRHVPESNPSQLTSKLFLDPITPTTHYQVDERSNTAMIYLPG